MDTGKGTNNVLYNATNKFSSVTGQSPSNTMVLIGVDVGGTFYPSLGIVNQYGNLIDIFTARSDPSATVSNILYFGEAGRFLGMDFKIHGTSDGNAGPRFVRNFMKDDGITQEAGDYLNQYSAVSIAQEIYTTDTTGGFFVWSVTNAALTLGNRGNASGFPTYRTEVQGTTLSNTGPNAITLASSNITTFLPSQSFLLTVTALPLGAGTTNITWIGVTRRWTNATSASEILTNLNGTTFAATNLYNAFTISNPPTGDLLISWVSPTSMLFKSYNGFPAPTLASAGGWATIVTNAVTNELQIVIDKSGVSTRASAGFTAGISSTAGTTNSGTAATAQTAPLLVFGSLNFPAITNTTLTVNRATNAVQAYTTNADFTVTFTGTPLDGARGEYRVWNTASTNINLGWPASWAEQTGAGVTTIPCTSNSLTRIDWAIQAGSNYVSYGGKDLFQVKFGSGVAAGQFLKIHSLSGGAGGTMELTNDSVTGASGIATNGGTGYNNSFINATFVQGSDATGAGLAAVSIKPGPSPMATNAFQIQFAASTAIGVAARSNGNFGININIPTDKLHVVGDSTLDGIAKAGSMNVVTQANVNTMVVTQNITYASADINPTGNATNFQADCTFAWRTCLMTNAVSVTGAVNIAAANLNRPWVCAFRNYSGGALRVRLAANIRRSGTNDVSVGNNQAAQVTLIPDGTGGVNETNLLGQIVLFDSP